MREGVICRNEGVIYGTHKIPSSRAPVGGKNIKKNIYCLPDSMTVVVVVVVVVVYVGEVVAVVEVDVVVSSSQSPTEGAAGPDMETQALSALSSR